jgi:hypothetical protein
MQYSDLELAVADFISQVSFRNGNLHTQVWAANDLFAELNVRCRFHFIKEEIDDTQLSVAPHIEGPDTLYATVVLDHITNLLGDRTLSLEDAVRKGASRAALSVPDNKEDIE